MKLSKQVGIGISGGFLLLITLWPFMVMPGILIQAVENIFTGNAVFGQSFAGVLISVFVIILFVFGFAPRKVWELAAIYCSAFLWLVILNIPIESYLSSELEDVAIFPVFWPVLATANVLALLIVKMILMKDSRKTLLQPPIPL